MSTSAASSPSPATPDLLAPLDYLAIEFPAGADPGEILAPLRALVEAGTIGIVDVAFVAASSDGAVELLDIGAVGDRLGGDLDAWTGVASGLVDEDDAAVVADMVTPGNFGVVVVYENLWVLGIADAIARNGGRLVADGGVSTDDLLAALDTDENGA